jgi:predicted esterase
MFSLLLTTLMLAASPVPSDVAVSLNIDESRVTVSGLSAGGQMAHQLHIAYSDLFSGAGIIAGGPFGCADGSLTTAMARCMGKVDGALPVAELAAAIGSAAEEDNVADSKNLADDPVWLFHGTLDTTVASEVSDAAAALYAEFVPAVQIRYVNDVAAGHNFPARGQGHDCAAMLPPFVGDCDYDAAGEILQHLYSSLETPAPGPETTLKTVTLLAPKADKAVRSTWCCTAAPSLPSVSAPVSSNRAATCPGRKPTTSCWLFRKSYPGP